MALKKGSGQKAKWDQPQETQIRFSLSGYPGVLLNPDADLEVLQGGGLNPHGTKRLAWDRVVKIAARDDMPGASFQVAAGYFIPPAPPPGAEVNPLATDESGQWYKKHPEDSGFPLNPGRDDPSILDPYGDQHPQLYAEFRVHRPAGLVPYPPSMGWTPPQPPAGTAGVALLYVLTDTEGFGMPGVQIQERFWLGIPPGFNRNVWIYWKTVQAGERIASNSAEAAVDGVMNEPDYLWVVNEYVPFELDGHEYWAATTRTGYDVWVNPEGGGREYYGVKVKCFKIVISLTFQGHEDGQNCSPATPPPD
jgi:hypothetical protein